MKILITGGSGFIGSSLLRALKGHEITVLDAIHPKGNAAFVRADITKQEEVNDVCRGFDAIIHLAAKSTPRETDVHSFYDINVKGTLNMLEAARKNDVGKFIFASTSHVYGSAPSPQHESQPCFPNSFYGASKLACESMCLVYSNMHGIKVSLPRFFTVYGPEGRKDMAVLTFIENINSGKGITVYGEGRIKKDFVHVNDAADAVKLMLESKTTGPLNIGSGKAIELNYLIKLIEAEIGKKAVVIHVPMQKWDADSHADITKATKELKWQPRIAIEQGIKETTKWWLSKKKLL